MFVSAEGIKLSIINLYSHSTPSLEHAHSKTTGWKMAVETMLLFTLEQKAPPHSLGTTL